MSDCTSSFLNQKMETMFLLQEAVQHIPVDFFLLKLMMMLPCSELDQITDLVKKDLERKESTKISSN